MALKIYEYACTMTNIKVNKASVSQTSGGCPLQPPTAKKTASPAAKDSHRTIDDIISAAVWPHHDVLAAVDDGLQVLPAAQGPGKGGELLAGAAVQPVPLRVHRLPLPPAEALTPLA
eukprot:scaffold645175_cov48-Prasinocladus_malaysianus.AAC.1